LILKHWRKKEILEKVENNIFNSDFNNVVKFYKERLEDYNLKKLSLDPFKSDKLYKELKFDTISKFKNIKKINIDLLY
jgi:hypothetical protein